MINLPIGAIILWENDAIPTGWALCDGNNGTPNLIDKFVRGASIDGDIRGTGGYLTHSHPNSNTLERASHNHGGTKQGSTGTNTSGTWMTSGTEQETYSAKAHNHQLTFVIALADAHSHTLNDTNASSSLPAHIKRVFIRRIS